MIENEVIEKFEMEDKYRQDKRIMNFQQRPTFLPVKQTHLWCHTTETGKKAAKKDTVVRKADRRG